MARFILTLLAVLVSSAASYATPLEAFGHLPSLEDVSLSPDGSRIAFVRTAQNHRTLGIVSLSEHKAMGALDVGEVKLRSVSWADNDHLMILTSETSLPWNLSGTNTEWFHLQVYDVVNRVSKEVPDYRRLSQFNMMNVVSGAVMVREVDGHTILFVPGVYLSGQTLRALVRYDLNTGNQTVVTRGNKNTMGWLVGADGEVAADSNYDEVMQTWGLGVRRNGAMVMAAEGTVLVDPPSLLGFGQTNDTVLMQVYENGDPVLRLYSMKDKTFEPLTVNGNPIGIPFRDPRSDRLIGGVREGNDNRYTFLDPALQAQWNAIVTAFHGDHLKWISENSDFSKIVIRVEGPKTGLLYELVDMKTRTAESLGPVYDGIARPLAVRRITYPAADGLSIPAYLTLPNDREPKNLPLIVLAHGGPASLDTADFDWWSQALADQGYAVLRSNFRGSTTNWKHVTAGFGQWGRKMQTDLSDGVRYLAEKGTIDPARVCIVGASYGGYAALAGITLDPGVYRCAVSVAGLSDLRQFLRWVDTKNSAGSERTQRYWNRFMGVSGSDDPVAETLSPDKHVTDTTPPLLLIHGKDDTVVPFEQSTLMDEAMRRANRPVQLVTLKDEDHWLSRSETRLQMLEATVTFLRSNNPPDR